MVIKVMSLRLINWQGAIDEEVVFGGESCAVVRPNGKGKTRMANADKWVKTGKDMSGYKDANIKNTQIPDLNKEDHVVIEKLLVDRREVELKRVYKEVWTKKTGTDEVVLTSHKTEFYKDGQEHTQTSYKELINMFAPEMVWNLTTDPLFFNTNVVGKWEWTNQRRVLMDMAGMVSNDEVLERSESNYGRLDVIRQLIADQTDLTLQLNTLKSRLKVMKEHHKTFEPSIKEAKVKRPVETEKDFKKLEKEIEILSEKEDAIIEQMTSVQNATLERMLAFNEKSNKVEEIKMKLANIKSSIRRQHQSKFDEKSRTINELNQKISRVEKSIQSEQMSLDLENRKIKMAEDKVAKLRQEFIDTRSSEFKFDAGKYTSKRCPTCGQMVEENHDLEHISSELEKEFNTQKASKMESIRASAAEQQALIPKMQEVVVDIQAAIKTKREEIELIEFELSQAEKYDMPTETMILAEASEGEEWQELQSLLEEAEKDIPEKPKEADVEDKKQARKEIMAERDRILGLLSGRERIKEVDARVDHLEQEEKAHGQKMAEVEREIYAITAFQRANYEIVEERVNLMFEDVSFKLFRPQMNGTFEEICDCWYKERTWASLNTADKITAGLLCIKAFQQQYNFYAPIWIDNRESIQQIPDMPNTQIINLAVPPLVFIEGNPV